MVRIFITTNFNFSLSSHYPCCKDPRVFDFLRSAFPHLIASRHCSGIRSLLRMVCIINDTFWLVRLDCDISDVLWAGSAVRWWCRRKLAALQNRIDRIIRCPVSVEIGSSGVGIKKCLFLIQIAAYINALNTYNEVPSPVALNVLLESKRVVCFSF